MPTIKKRTDGGSPYYYWRCTMFGQTRQGSCYTTNYDKAVQYWEQYIQPMFLEAKAQEQIQKLRRDVGELPNIPTHHVSLKDFAKQYLERTRMENADTTYRQQRSILLGRRGFVHAVGANKALRDITSDDIARWKSRALERVSGRTFNAKLGVVRAMFNAAVSWDIIERSPARGVKRASTKPVDRDELSADDVQALLSALEDGGDDLDSRAAYIGTAIALGTGARVGELLDLQRDDVDLDAGIVCLRNAKTASRTGEAEREVPIGDFLCRLLQGWLASHSRALVCGGLTYAAFRERLKAAGQAAGLGKVTPHVLRHTFISHTSRGDLASAQALAGHSRLATTEQYLHRNGDDYREAVEALPFFRHK